MPPEASHAASLAVRLDDYRPPAFLVDEVELDFQLEPERTRVRARLHLRRNPAGSGALFLNGERLKPVRFALDGRPLGPNDYRLTEDGLTLASAPDVFVFDSEVEIDPKANTALEGLYMSGGRFCTQCEAEGFRKITFFPDRPDVLARYRVRIEADADAFPRLLSNGNLEETGQLEGGRHYAVWRDPFPKPAYLFALVAGELDALSDTFVTASGRTIALKIFVDPGQTARAAYALDALRRAMAWDETAYGREYDLDLFQIVAVRDFNFGAMENKGLNIFNSSLLLADAQTATDLDFERIESVVAHEYFHNWTGNRITCRDWFQLCVKEGLTVFRDQGFSADQRGRAVQRIKDVKALRARQFPEDAGPLAHPVRPSAYVEINNFYTATVYEKGAEVIGMLKTLLGAEAFRRGMDLYFATFDGQAVTVEDFLGCFERATGSDLSGFRLWYGQAGTPRLRVETHWDAAAQALTLTLAQTSLPTPGQPTKSPLVTPVRLGLLDSEGRVQRFVPPGGGEPVEETVLVLNTARTETRLEGVASPPIVSGLRAFSAPVLLDLAEPPEHRFVRLAADPDLFNRWEAGQELARDLILARAAGDPDPAAEVAYARAVGRALADTSSDDAFKALLLSPPSEQDLAMAMHPADPGALHRAREALRAAVAGELREALEAAHDRLDRGEPFTADAAGAGRRALRNGALDLLASARTPADAARAARHYAGADNMTDAMAGLSALAALGGDACEAALADFYDRWRGEPLVVDKWFAVQARAPGPATLGRVLGLTAHPAFDPRNPNRLRALVQSFSQGNPACFHDASGDGYRFLADQILAVDGLNPMTAARLVEPLGAWRRYRPDLAAGMRAQLQRLLDHPGLSRNVLELAGKALQD